MKMEGRNYVRISVCCTVRISNNTKGLVNIRIHLRLITFLQKHEIILGRDTSFWLKKQEMGQMRYIFNYATVPQPLSSRGYWLFTQLMFYGRIFWTILFISDTKVQFNRRYFNLEQDNKLFKYFNIVLVKLIPRNKE